MDKTTAGILSGVAASVSFGASGPFAKSLIDAGLAYVEPAAAATIAWLALGERLNPVQIVRGVVVLAGAFLAQRGIVATPVDGVAQVPAPANGTDRRDAMVPGLEPAQLP